MDKMEEIFELEVPQKKIYKERAIFIGALVGGPILGAYFIAENFKVFKEPRKAKAALLIGISLGVLIISSAFFLPNVGRSFDFFVAIVVAAIAQVLVRKYQGQDIERHFEAGGTAFSWGRVILSILGFTILLMLLIMLLFFIFGQDISTLIE